jgi:hypothetical protein
VNQVTTKAANETQQPQDHQNHDNCPQHYFNPPSSSLLVAARETTEVRAKADAERLRTRNLTSLNTTILLSTDFTPRTPLTKCSAFAFVAAELTVPTKLTNGDLIIDSLHSLYIPHCPFRLSFQAFGLDGAGERDLAVRHGSHDTKRRKVRIVAQLFVDCGSNRRAVRNIASVVAG